MVFEFWDPVEGLYCLMIWTTKNYMCGTHQQVAAKKLPYYPTFIEFYPLKHGFGYDSSNDDYLVAIAYDDESADDSGTRIDLLSLKYNSWRKVDRTYPYMSHMNIQDRGALLNGAIHWLAYLSHGEGEVILAFDLIQKNVSELPLPNDYVVDLEMYTCRVLGGCFSIFIAGKFRTDIWIMKEYGVKSSWLKCIMVYFGETHQPFSPIYFTKGGEVVRIYHDGSMKRKHEGKLLELRLNGIDESNAVMYTECLLALPSNIEEGGGEVRHQ